MNIFPRVLPLAICLSLLGMATISSGGERIKHVIESERLAGSLVGEGTTKPVFVYLPDGYRESTERYPVVYWFPGAGLSQTTGIEFDLIDQEFNSGRSVPSILVLMPGRTTSFRSSTYLSSEAFGDWEGFLTSEVVPFIDDTYRTQSSPDRRGIMGFSLGGFTALMMPVLAPDTFGAVGANDPSLQLISGMVRSPDEIPEGVVGDGDSTLEEFLDGFPDSLGGVRDVSHVHSALSQIAARFSPNPNSPFHGDLPFDEQGEWIPESRQQWRDFDLLDPDSIELHRAALQDLSTVSIILPRDSDDVATPWSEELIEVARDAGMPAQGIDFAGDHNDLQYERFTALLSNVSHALTEEKPERLGGGYRQVFDAALGLDDSGGVLLPAGWSVTDQQAFVFRDRTNTAFDRGNVEPIGQAPYILNVGGEQDADRALGIYLDEDSGQHTIQFEADVSAVEAYGFQLSFAIEGWDTERPSQSEPGETAFEIVAELDFGDGFQQPIGLGIVRGDSMLPLPTDPYSDGNQDDNRVVFESEIITAPVHEAASLRLRWMADVRGTQQWVFGLDDVELSFLLFGDFDESGTLTALDIDLLSAAVREENASSLFDLNGDTLVDASDRDRWVRELVGTSYGDADLDKSVDFSDFLSFSSGFGSEAGWAGGDFDGDGEVGFGDFLMLSKNFGPSPPPSRVAAVPEPSASVLLLTVTAIAISVAWRKDGAPRHWPGAGGQRNSPRRDGGD